MRVIGLILPFIAVFAIENKIKHSEIAYPGLSGEGREAHGLLRGFDGKSTGFPS
jgi:hypothetical protein